MLQPFAQSGILGFAYTRKYPIPATANTRRRLRATNGVESKEPDGKRREGIGQTIERHYTIEAALQIVNAEQCERPGPPENIHKIAMSAARWDR